MKNRVLSDLGLAIIDFNRTVAIFEGCGVHFDLQFLDGKENLLTGLLLHLDQGMDLEVSLLWVSDEDQSRGMAYGLPGDGFSGIWPDISCDLTLETGTKDNALQPTISINISREATGRKPETRRIIYVDMGGFIGPIPKRFSDIASALKDISGEADENDLSEEVTYQLISKLAEEIAEILYQMKLHALPKPPEEVT